MTNSTNTCPRSTPWCEQHEVLDVVDNAGQAVERHVAWLFTRYAPIQPLIPATALYISDSTALSTGPGLALQQYDNPPQSISPQDARQLAAALMRGAEIVEASLTATCPTCSRPAAPADLEFDPDGDGACCACRRRQWGDHLERRAAMSLVHS